MTVIQIIALSASCISVISALIALRMVNKSYRNSRKAADYYRDKYPDMWEEWGKSRNAK